MAFHALGMAGFVGADIFIRWVGRLPAAVADGGVNHARNALERGLHAPETSRSKCCHLSHGILPRIKFLLPIPRPRVLDARDTHPDSVIQLRWFAMCRRSH